MIILRKIASVQDELGAIIADTVSGTLNGSNRVFYTTYAYRPDHITIYYNGQALHPDDGFLQTGANEITLNYFAPLASDHLRATYELNTINYDYAAQTKGQEALSLGDTSKIITFVSPTSDSNYNVSANLITSDAGTPSIYSWVVAQKSINGFTVFFSGEMDSNNYVLEWEIFN